MQWPITILYIGIFFLLLYLVREKSTPQRVLLFGLFSLFFGYSLFGTGIEYPTGSIVTTSGNTTTTVVTFTTYLATLSNTPLLFGLAWALFLTGVLCLPWGLAGTYQWILGAVRKKNVGW